MTQIQSLPDHVTDYLQTPEDIIRSFTSKLEGLTGGPGSAAGIAAVVVESRLTLPNLFECATCGSVAISVEGVSKTKGVVVSGIVQYTPCNGVRDVPASVLNTTADLNVLRSPNLSRISRNEIC